MSKINRLFLFVVRLVCKIVLNFVFVGFYFLVFVYILFCSKVLIIVVDDCYNFEYCNVKVCLMKRIGRDNKIVVVVGIVIDDF